MSNFHLILPSTDLDPSTMDHHIKSKSHSERAAHIVQTAFASQ